jgi:hypothetical protein
MGNHTTRRDGSPIISAEDVRQYLIISEEARTVRYGPMRTEVSQLVERMKNGEV